MGKVFSNGPMEENIKVNLNRIRDTVMVSFSGKMDDDIKVNGKWGNSME